MVDDESYFTLSVSNLPTNREFYTSNKNQTKQDAC